MSNKKDDTIGCLLQIIIVLIFIIMYTLARVVYGDLMDL